MLSEHYYFMMKIGRPQKEAKPMTLIMLEVHLSHVNM